MITFAYAYEIEAEDEKGAEEKAIKLFSEEQPTLQEMGINTEELKVVVK